MTRFETAKNCVQNDELVVFPTETVYGLAGDALSETAIEKVYKVKKRSPSKPISLATPSFEESLQYVHASEREELFMESFLPGPVTVLVEKRARVPDILTSGREKVGVRVPDHDVALQLLESVSPLTATSANISGTGSVVNTDKLSRNVLDNVGCVVDDGVLDGGTGSTVVDVEENEIHREGAVGKKVREWLQNN